MFAILSVPCSLPLPLPLHLHLYVHLWGRASPTGKGKQAGQQCGSTCDLVLAMFLCPFPHHLLFPPFLPNLSPCPLISCPSPPSPLSCAPFPSSLLYTLPLHLAPPPPPPPPPLIDTNCFTNILSLNLLLSDLLHFFLVIFE